MSPLRVSRVTPGVVRAKSMKLRPFTGRFDTATAPTVVAWWVRAGSMMGASAVTVTSSCAPDTCMPTSTVRVWPMLRVRFGRLVVEKPAREAVTS